MNATMLQWKSWELRQHLCLAIGANAYFPWQLFDNHRLLKDHYFVANVAKDVTTEIFLLTIKRRLRPPSSDGRADILYYMEVYTPGVYGNVLRSCM